MTTPPRPKTNWKAKLDHAQKQWDFYHEERNKFRDLVNQLRIERDAAERARDEAIVRASMKMPSSVEYRFKEVLPFWFGLIIWSISGTVLIAMASCWLHIREIHKNISVFDALYVPDVVRYVQVGQPEKMAACQEAWKESEFENKVLRRKVRELR